MRKVCCQLHLSKAILEAFFYGIFILRTHLPKRDHSTGTTVRVRVIKDMAQLVWGISINEERNASCTLVHPTTEPVPSLDFRTGRRIRLLGMDQQLLLKAVLIVVGGGNEKVRVSLCLGGDIPRGLGCQLRNDLVFARHGITSLLYFDCDLNGLFLLTKNRCKQQAGSGIGNLRNKLIEPANCVVDFFLIVCVVISRLIAANRKAILPESTDLAANISSVKHEQLFKLLAVDGFFLADMILAEIFADGFLSIHRFLLSHRFLFISLMCWEIPAIHLADLITEASRDPRNIGSCGGALV